MVSQVEIDSICHSGLIVICISQQLLMIDDSANKLSIASTSISHRQLLLLLLS